MFVFFVKGNKTYLSVAAGVMPVSVYLKVKFKSGLKVEDQISTSLSLSE